jgi:hypothetical protein
MKNKLHLLFCAGLVLAAVPLLLSPLFPTRSHAQSAPPDANPTATISCTKLPDGRVCVTIFYPSDTNHNYIVEYRESFSPGAAEWKQLPEAPHNRGLVSVTNSATERLYRIRVMDQPQKGIFAVLADDTGLSPYDGITMDPTVNGQVAETGTPNDLAGLLDSTDGVFTTLIPNIPSRSNFVINSNQLADLAGGTLPDGPHSLHLQKYDEVRNILWKAELDFVLDTHAPDTFIISHPPNPSASTATEFTFTGTDDLTPVNQLRYEFRHSAPPDPATTNWSLCTSPLRFDNLSRGLHVFEVRALDLAGNLDPTPAAFTWTIDTKPPSITLALDPGTTRRHRATSPPQTFWSG